MGGSLPYPSPIHASNRRLTDLGHRVGAAEQQRLGRLLSAAEFRNLGIAGA